MSHETEFVDSIPVRKAHAARFASAVGKSFLGNDDRAVPLPKAYFNSESLAFCDFESACLRCGSGDPTLQFVTRPAVSGRTVNCSAPRSM